jgi:hypothetical protein
MTVRRLLRDKARSRLLARQGAELSEATMPGHREDSQQSCTPVV